MNKIRAVWEKLGLRTWADWRNAIHVVTPILVMAMAHFIGADIAESIGVFLVTAISPTIAFWNSTSTLRAWVYGMMVPLQGLLVALDIVTQAQFAGVASIILALVNAVLASTNTNTSSAEPVATATVGEKITRGRHAAA